MKYYSPVERLGGHYLRGIFGDVAQKPVRRDEIGLHQLVPEVLEMGAHGIRPFRYLLEFTLRPDTVKRSAERWKNGAAECEPIRMPEYVDHYGDESKKKQSPAYYVERMMDPVKPRRVAFMIIDLTR